MKLLWAGVNWSVSPRKAMWNKLKCRRAERASLMAVYMRESRQFRAKRALSLFKDVPLRTRRVLSLYKVFSISLILVLNETSLNNDSARAANLSLSKKVLLSLKKHHILRWKKVFLREERASWARSVHHERKVLSAGVQGPLKVQEAHGFRCSLVQS